MKYLKDTETCEAAVDCVCSLLVKGMLPETKIQLVVAVDALLDGDSIYSLNEVC
jgi:hypothetical protein